LNFEWDGDGMKYTISKPKQIFVNLWNQSTSQWNSIGWSWYVLTLFLSCCIQCIL